MTKLEADQIVAERGENQTQFRGAEQQVRHLEEQKRIMEQ